MTGNLIESRDVVFVERSCNSCGSSGSTNIAHEQPAGNVEPRSLANVKNEMVIADGESEIEEVLPVEQTGSDEVALVEENEIPQTETAETLRRYPLRERNVTQFFGDVRCFEAVAFYGGLPVTSEPASVKDALRDNNWKAAMEKEIRSFNENDVWVLVKAPANANVVKHKWVFKTKTDSDGNVKCHRARLVAKGFTQRYGIDYYETFSPVISYSTLRLLFALTVQMNLETVHLDIETAFLYGELSEEIFLEQPEGFKISGQENKVYRLKRAIYGLKQSARTWNLKVSSVLRSLGYKECQNENCLFVYKRENVVVMVAIFMIFLCSTTMKRQ